MDVLVLGRFPPPLDGQTLATERLASLLECEMRVRRVNTEVQPETTAHVMPRLHRARHFLRLRPRLRNMLAEHPNATVLWPAVSPDPLGHLRDLLVTIPAIRKSQRVISIVHRGNFHQIFARSVTRPTAKRLARRLQGFVFLTQHLSNKCAAWIPDHKRIVIPNTIDDDVTFSDSEVAEKRAARGNRKPLSLLFLSHMLPSKGYLDVLDGIILAHHNDIRVDAHFAGAWQSDVDREAFFSRIHEAGLDGVITHHGPIFERKAAKELHRRADVLLLPTYYQNEAQPLVLLEALNAGTPVITTRHAGISELIQDGREGLLVPPRNPAALARAVDRLLDVDFWQSTSRQARKTFLGTYASNKVRERWRRFIEDLREGHPPTSRIENAPDDA